MKKHTIIITLLVVFLMLITTLLGCGGNEEVDKTEKAINSENHVDNTVETDRHLVQNGTTNYYIVYTEDPSSATSDAVTELKNFFKEATGIELRAVTDNGLQHNDQNTIISIGKTGLFKTSGLYDEFACATRWIKMSSVAENKREEYLKTLYESLGEEESLSID